MSGSRVSSDVRKCNGGAFCQAFRLGGEAMARVELDGQFHFFGTCILRVFVIKTSIAWLILS